VLPTSTLLQSAACGYVTFYCVIYIATSTPLLLVLLLLRYFFTVCDIHYLLHLRCYSQLLAATIVLYQEAFIRKGEDHGKHQKSKWNI
jgi:hypothetical protein